MNAKVSKSAKKKEIVLGQFRKHDLPEEVERVVHAAIGCAIEVHRHLGPGLLESIYEQALLYELAQEGLEPEQQVEITVPYKETMLRGQRMDLVVNRCLVIELKAVKQVQDIHKAQTLSYIRAIGYPIGLLINFNVPILKSGLHRIFNERSQFFISSPSR